MRLAHFSDLHLLSHDGARWLELANKRWIGAMNLLSNRSRHYHVAAFDDMIEDLNAQDIDHVLCTGDVTNLALRQEFEFARAKFAKLAGGVDTITCIPGNHDAYVAAGIPLFTEVFGDLCSTDPGWEWTEADADARGETAGELHWPIVRVRGPLAIIGLSTSRATPWFTAYGRIDRGQLARVKRVLADPRLAGKVRLVAIHHPAAGKRAFSRIRGLKDHAAFAEVIAEVGADWVVHGHEHRDMTEVLAGPSGPVTVRGIASGTYFHNKPDKTARYRIYEIEDATIREVGVRVWDPETHQFGPPQALQLNESTAQPGTRKPAT